MHPSRLFDSLCSDFPDIYILQNTSQKMYKAKEKKNAVDTEKNKRIKSKLFKQVITNKRKIEAL